MLDSPGSRLSPEEFSRLLDEAKTRAVMLRREAVREFGSSVVAAATAAARRLAHAARGGRSQVRRAAHSAR